MRIGPLYLHEILQALAGVLILVSVPLIAFYGNFTWWFVAKGLYLVGVVGVLAAFCHKQK